MALVACKECGKEVSTQAAACPGCGAPVAAGAKPAMVVVEKKSSNVWMWVLGVPVGLFALMMVIGALQPANPEKDAARAAYDRCIEMLKSEDRARSSGATMLAGACERMRTEFIRKYNVNP